MRTLLTICIGLTTGVGLAGCRDRGQDVTGGRWIGDSIDERGLFQNQRVENPEAFAITVPEAPTTDAPVSAAPAEDEAAAEVVVPVFDPEAMPRAPTVDKVTAELLAEAEALTEKGRAAAALAQIKRAALRQPDAPEVLLALGRAHARLANHRDAEQAFGRLLEQKPRVVDAIYGKVLAHVHLGEFDAARPFARTLEGLRPDDPNVRRLVARIASPSDALAKSRRAAATGDPAALREHADRLARAGELTEAANYYGLAAASFPDDADLHTRWGTALAAAGRLDAATEALQAAVKLDPRQLTAWQNLASIHERLGRRAAAADALQDLVRHLPSADRNGRIQARITRLRTGL